jgi:hypothetical protein
MALPLNTSSQPVDTFFLPVDQGPFVVTKQAFGYSGVGREAIYATLASYLQTILGLSTVYRARPNLTGLNANTSPVGFLMQAHSKAIRTKEMAPTRYQDTAIFCVGVAQQSADPTFVAATALNNLRDLLDLALTRDSPDMWRCTLGGIVDYARPVQDIYAETLQNDVWTTFTTTIEFLYTPINFV